MSEESALFQKLNPHEYYEAFASKGIRPDGRKFEEGRKAALESGTIGSAEGSCVASLGNSKVVCGIKSSVISPEDYSKSFTEGVINVNVILSPLCSTKFKVCLYVYFTYVKSFCVWFYKLPLTILLSLYLFIYLSLLLILFLSLSLFLFLSFYQIGKANDQSLSLSHFIYRYITTW